MAGGQLLRAGRSAGHLPSRRATTPARVPSRKAYPVTYRYLVKNTGDVDLDFCGIQDFIFDTDVPACGCVEGDGWINIVPDYANGELTTTPSRARRDLGLQVQHRSSCQLGTTDQQRVRRTRTCGRTASTSLQQQDPDVSACDTDDGHRDRGRTGGGTGTPAASLPNSAVNVPGSVTDRHPRVRPAPAELARRPGLREREVHSAPLDQRGLTSRKRRDESRAASSFLAVPRSPRYRRGSPQRCRRRTRILRTDRTRPIHSPNRPEILSKAYSSVVPRGYIANAPRGSPDHPAIAACQCPILSWRRHRATTHPRHLFFAGPGRGPCRHSSSDSHVVSIDCDARRRCRQRLSSRCRIDVT